MLKISLNMDAQSGLEDREYGCGDPSLWLRITLYPQKLALTSPTRGGRLVGIVPSRTKATDFSFSHSWSSTSAMSAQCYPMVFTASLDTSHDGPPNPSKLPGTCIHNAMVKCLFVVNWRCIYTRVLGGPTGQNPADSILVSVEAMEWVLLPSW
jgi:hypothetical protein